MAQETAIVEVGKDEGGTVMEWRYEVEAIRLLKILADMGKIVQVPSPDPRTYDDPSFTIGIVPSVTLDAVKSFVQAIGA